MYAMKVFRPRAGIGIVGGGGHVLCHQGIWGRGEGGIEYVSTQWLGNQLSLPIEYVSTVDKSVLQ